MNSRWGVYAFVCSALAYPSACVVENSAPPAPAPMPPRPRPATPPAPPTPPPVVAGAGGDALVTEAGAGGPGPGDAAPIPGSDAAPGGPGGGGGGGSSEAPLPAPPAPAFLTCKVDSECVAVPRNGCCNNGHLEAVNASQVAAYKASFTCPEPRPICPMFRIRDTRAPECNNDQHACEMVRPEDIRCGGPGPNPHRCPGSLRCQGGDGGALGTCVP